MTDKGRLLTEGTNFAMPKVPETKNEFQLLYKATASSNNIDKTIEH